MVKLAVGFDLDGVLYNFGDSVKRYLDFIGNGDIWKSGPTPTPYWDFYKDWGWTSDEFVQMCNDGVDAGIIFCGDARPGGPETVRRIKDAGHNIVIITDRKFGSTPEASQRNTFDWLDQHEIPYDAIAFSSDKTKLRTDIFVEDKLQNYDSIVAAGTPCVMVNRPWNMEDDERMRIHDVMEYPRYVEMIAMAKL